MPSKLRSSTRQSPARSLPMVLRRRAVTGAGIGLDAELHDPAHEIALIPAVLNRGGGCGLYLRVENIGPGGTCCPQPRIASP